MVLLKRFTVKVDSRVDCRPVIQWNRRNVSPLYGLIVMENLAETKGSCVVKIHSASPQTVLEADSLMLDLVDKQNNFAILAWAFEGSKYVDIQINDKAIKAGNRYEIGSAPYVYIRCQLEESGSRQSLTQGWVVVREVNLNLSAMKLVIEFEFSALYNGQTYTFKGDASLIGRASALGRKSFEARHVGSVDGAL